MLTNEFDPERNAIINPSEVVAPVHNFPKVCIGIFSDVILEEVLKEYGREKIAELHSCAGELPIWRVRRNGREYGVFLAMPGGPMIIGQIEEFGAMGGRNFVLFGSCGVLDAHIDHGNIILPAAAVRDEGVSYQYIAPADEIALSEDAVAAAEEALKSLGYPYIKGKTWTTDCFYRETRGKMETRIAGGCIAVEMECASAAAVTEFRGYRFAQFLFAADNLASEVWERRNLSDKGIHSCDLYLNAAFAIGDNLSMLSDNS